MPPVAVSCRKNKIELQFAYDDKIITAVKTLPGRKWDPEKRLWIVPLDYPNWLSLKTLFPGTLSLSATALAQDLRYHLAERNYSKKTIRSYCRHIQSFFTFCNLQPDDVTDTDIHRYLHEKVESGLSNASIRQIYQALIYFFSHLYPKLFVVKLSLPKKERRLPEILSEREVLTIVEKPAHPKHKLLLKLAYSSGLRVSELVSLKWQDIDLDRGLLRIRQGKGKKDRVSILSKKMEVWIRDYKESNLYIEENDYLFPGQLGQKHLHIRTAQKIFEMAVLKSGIQKKVSIHSLRHAFATHMLEQGTDIRYIQFLLGHKNLKTTQIYTHVARTSIMNLTSPFDKIEF